MQTEYTYIAIVFMVVVFVLISLWRVFRGAGKTIRQLNEESRRDRLQHERIARERQAQSRALRRGTRGINGTAYKVNWDQNGRRAQRTYHVDEAADEVFDPVSDVRGMDVRTPWGWPGSKKVNGRRPYKPRPPASERVKTSVSQFFRPKQLVDDEFRARRERSIRSLVEDRYGRVGFHANRQMSEVEWSRPALPKELLRERATDQMFATRPSMGVESKTRKLKGLQVVGGKPRLTETKQKASGA